MKKYIPILDGAFRAVSFWKIKLDEYRLNNSVLDKYKNFCYNLVTVKKGEIKMIAWYWILISIVMTNFLTILLSDTINFENLWEDFLFTLFYPFVWIGKFPYAFFRNFFVPATQQQFEEVATGTDRETIYKLSKNVYLWHDKKAEKIHNHWFLVRIK